MIENTDNILITLKVVKLWSGDKGSKRFKKQPLSVTKTCLRVFWCLKTWIDLGEPSPNGIQDMAGSETGIG